MHPLLRKAGRAIDINPWLNPFLKVGEKAPVGQVYDSTVPGTLTAESEVVAYFKAKGWDWGGDWTGKKDYMHFEI